MTALAGDAARVLGVTVTPEQEALFDVYARELAAWNAHTNLTAIIDPEGVRVRHFLDSLTLARVIPLRPGLRLIDVGAGAGFPGLPLKLLFPQIELTLLEATGKKVAFLRHVVAHLGLSAQCVNARAEQAGQDPTHRAAYDVAVARAVARLPILLEYLLPLTAVGGLAIAMKGSTAAEESAASAKALAALGGRLRSIETFRLPGVEEPHHLVIVEKTAPTPAIYPRRPGLPTQKPLS
ncbi:MAG: 16S rRNA (guanine(527)-N(7))-methyltransferase RsmG [Anaerolineae bacterium]|nr:16S rRNA (guanine(527)-N(7))-methyltransferase RsmG [Anaerolineae bacterium]NUQ07177.1 16S rRNA (guanine(527)-N(7))-methyltransferase RsmG [Anaerolineae bacterium]